MIIDDKLKNLNKKVTSNKTKHLLVISTKELTKDLTNGYKALDGLKLFSACILQNYLILIPPKNTLDFLMAQLKHICGNLMECHKKVLKIYLHQAETSLQL